MTTLITRRSLADEVAARLQEQVLEGKYAVNEKLPNETELMKQFGVGRSTIREAIKQLSNSGLLIVQQGLGTFVAPEGNSREPMDQRLKRANVEDLDEVRQLVELKIAEKAAMNRTDQDLQIMRKHLEARKINADKGLVEECIEADIEFHIAIAVASKNIILADLYKSVSVHLKSWFLDRYPDTRRFVETYKLHLQLYKNIEAQEPEKAWNTVAKIISH